MVQKNIIVFGGTGHQGSAFVRALAENNTLSNPAYKIHLLVRDATAARAEKLATLNGVTLVHVPHYMEAPDEAFEEAGLQVGDVHGAFLVSGYMDADKEVAQCVRVVKSAAAYGVKHFVYASVAFDPSKERGEDGMDAKRDIERAIKATNMDWTMLHDVDFMDNWLPTDGLIGRVWRTVLMTKLTRHPDRKIPMCATRDVGRIGALAITSGTKYLNKTIPIVGDLLSPAEIQATYEEVMGTKPERSWATTVHMAFWSDPKTAELAKYYDSDDAFSYIKGVQETKEVLPDVEDFKSFLERYKREKKLQEVMDRE